MYRLFFDGATNPNPGPMGVGAVLYEDDKEIASVACQAGHGTNNQSEYMALLCALALAAKHNIKEVEVCGDSQLIINQMTGVWKCSQETLSVLQEQAQARAAAFDRITYRWVRRNQNERADTLSKEGLNSDITLNDWLSERDTEANKALIALMEDTFDIKSVVRRTTLEEIRYFKGVGFTFIEDGTLFAVNLKPEPQCSCGEKQCSHLRKLMTYLKHRTMKNAA